MPSGAEIRERTIELLAPRDQLIGAPGHRRDDVRILEGSLEDAHDLFDKFRVLGQPVSAAHYPGELVTLGGRNRVGLRRRSKSGEPTIDVTLEWVPQIKKIKFVQGAST